MVIIKIAGMKDVKLTPHEFNLMADATKTMIRWGEAGMFGDGNDITDKAGLKRAHKVLSKLGYK